MRRRTLLAATATALAPGPLGAQPQKRDGVRRLGVLMGGEASDPLWKGLADIFVKSLADRGWRDGDNLRVDWRWAGDGSAIDRSASELVALKPDAIFCQTSPATAALRRATSTIPIIFVRVTDPIGQGLVTNLAHPGGNVTGFTDYDAPMAGKWLTMLTRIKPTVAYVAVVYNPAAAPFAPLMLRAIEDAAPAFSVTVQAVTVDDVDAIEPTLARVAQNERSSVLMLPHIFTSVHRAVVIAAVARLRLPAVYADRFFVTAGGLMSYGIDADDLFRRTALYVDRVLKGARVGDLPVQNPVKFVMALNLRTANEIGVTFAPTLLAAADEVIE